MIKSLSSEYLLRRISQLALKPPQYSSSTATLPQAENLFQSFRTSENNPINHSNDHIGQFYTLPAKETNIFAYGGIPKSYEIQTKTFNETSIMVRKPAIDLINTLRAIDYTQPAIRFVLYGKKGCGKSLTLAHILHFGHKSNFLLFHVPWVGNWMRRARESSNSETREGFIDINIDAAAWLVHFKSQNQHLLNDANLVTHQDYVWSRRETTPQNSSLVTLIEHGINRIKYASDCIVHLANEIKLLSNADKCKTLVVIDGFNAFFYPKTRIRTEKKEIVHPHKVTPTLAALSLTKFDWKNAAVVLAVDELAIAEEDQQSHLPRFLLGKDGFDHLDPFIPISVDNYSEKEFLSCMDYYRERKWVNYGGVDSEVAFLSGSNPYKIMEIVASL